MKRCRIRRWPRSRLVLLGCLILYLGPRTAAAAETPPFQGCRIEGIRIERHDVFDLEEESEGLLLARLANALHTETREGVIRRELLLHPGERYDQALAEESERNLRSLGIFGETSVTVEPASERAVFLKVRTQDRFSLNLGGSYSQEGGIRDERLFFTEYNFLGRALEVHAEVNRASDRRHKMGSAIFLDDPRLGNSRWHARAQFRDAEDLRIRTVLLEYPFSCDSLPWAGAVYAEQGSQQRRVYKDGQIVFDGQDRLENGTAWIANSRGGRTKLRLACAYDRARNTSSEETRGADDRLDLFNFGALVVRRRFVKATNLNNLSVVEDVPLGYQVHSALGVNPHRSGPDPPEGYAQAGCQIALGDGNRHYFGLSLQGHSFLHDGRLQDGLLSVLLVQHHRLSAQHCLVARAAADLGRHWPDGRQMTLGSNNGLRGYPQNRFAGQRLLLLNLEDRTSPLARIWIFRLGAALFADAGTCWGEYDPLDQQRLHASAGLGLRIASAKSGGSGLMRIDLPYRFDGGGFPEIIITADQLFSSFFGLNYITPHHQP